jgi:hypothetical protein
LTEVRRFAAAGARNAEQRQAAEMAIKGNEAKIERIDAMMERSLQFKTLPDGSYVSFDPSSGEVQQLGSAPAGASNGTYGKPPSGFMYDPEDPTRLTSIPGGPGEQISGEGQIGPKLRKRPT